jgi:hypothetical protein
MAKDFHHRVAHPQKGVPGLNKYRWPRIRLLLNDDLYGVGHYLSRSIVITFWDVTFGNDGVCTRPSEVIYSAHVDFMS